MAKNKLTNIGKKTVQPPPPMGVARGPTWQANKTLRQEKHRAKIFTTRNIIYSIIQNHICASWEINAHMPQKKNIMYHKHDLPQTNCTHGHLPTKQFTIGIKKV